MARRSLLVALLLLSPAVIGCKRSKMPELHPVRGRVIKGGEPVANALVRLQPETAELKEFKITGITDSNGDFDVETLEPEANKKKRGAPEGIFKVEVLLPQDANQSGGGKVESPRPITVQAGDNSIPVIEVGGPRK